MARAIEVPRSAGREFPEWGAPEEQLRFLLGWAVLAPSRHNAQPWLFEIDRDELRVRADVARALPAADPDGRQLLMSCGAAVVNLRLAAAHFGIATSLEVVSGPRRDGLLARVRLEERRSPAAGDEEMFRAIPLRRTNRLPPDGRDPPEGLVTALLREARREGAWLRPIEERERSAVAELVAEGDRRQRASPRFRAELAAWTRPNGTARRDGMPGYALGMSGTVAALQPFLARLGGSGREAAERERHRAATSRALVLLSTRCDGKEEWIAAGEALQRVLLHATASGLHAAFFSQPIEHPDLRRRLGRLLVDPGAPQILFRLSFGTEVQPVPRRSVGDVLVRCEEGRHREEALALRMPPPVARAAPGGAGRSPLN